VIEVIQPQAVEIVAAIAPTPEAVEPIESPTQAVVATAPQAAAAPAVDLNVVLSQAGLELVHTDASMVSPIVASAPVRQHPPRERKPRSQVADEPLQLVETQD
jgi:hypothetical protein